MIKSYSALIVEDVDSASEYLKERIKLLSPSIEEIEQAYNIDDAYKLLSSRNFDLVFLDIQLPTGSGFDLLKKLSSIHRIGFEVIFVTGESAKEWALRAIKYSAIDFLYKPVDDSDLSAAISKAIDTISNKHYNEQIRLLLDRVTQSNHKEVSRIAFHLRNGIIEFIELSKIIYLQADGVITHIYLSGDKKITAMRNLGFYKEMLVADYNFYVISNSLLVNYDYISRYDSRNQEITLLNGKKLYASKRCGKNFKDNFSSLESSSVLGNFLKKIFK